MAREEDWTEGVSQVGVGGGGSGQNKQWKSRELAWYCGEHLKVTEATRVESRRQEE